MKLKNILNTIQQQGLLPLYFHKDKTVSIEVLKALYRAGIRAVEYTNRGEQAFENFTAMLQLRDAELPGLYLGIGTIKNLHDAERYTEAGADFLISPGLVPEVAAYAVPKGLLYAPGCMTPTEIIAAENSGVGFIKLFPGNALGPEFMASIKGVFPGLLFMPTGGVEPEAASIKAWMDAGVCAVGMGSRLLTNALLESKDYAAIEANIKKLLGIIREIKKS
jgi:2-dehydro-3-deoxyphosphogluconate aldolase/(4S)-4-hydroxy-2-oxoglutarate aldolase